jgi:ribosome-associated protein
MIPINEEVMLPEEELSFTPSRSSGPGGQNVNKVNTRMTVLLDIRGSLSFSEEQKQLIFERLHTRISREGVLRVASQRHRTQGENRDEAVRRLVELIRSALKQEPPRKKTRIPVSANAVRLDAKRKRSTVKRARRNLSGEEE